MPGDVTPPTARLYTEYADPGLNEDPEGPAFGGDHRNRYGIRRPPATTHGRIAGRRTDATRTVPTNVDLLPHPGRRAGALGPRPTAARPAVIHPDFDPAEIDRSDFESDPTVPREGMAPTIPTPRPAEQPRLRITGGTAMPARRRPDRRRRRPADDADGGQDRDGASIGGMLIVSDLDRSLRFYSETARLHDRLCRGRQCGGRVRRRRGSCCSTWPTSRRSTAGSGHLHIEVPDLEAAFTDLVRKGVAVQPPPEDGQPRRRDGAVEGDLPATRTDTASR